MEPDWTLAGVSKSDIGAHAAVKPRRVLWSGRLLAIVATLVAIGAIGAALWIYADLKRETLRLATDIAQIRLSLDLYSRRAPAGASANAAGNTPAPTGADLQNLRNRIAILEDAWRGGATNAVKTAPSALPALPGGAAAKTTGVVANDCLPQNTRFLVTGGDAYPVCNTKGTVSIAAVGDGDVTFGDGSSIAAGGNATLKGTRCNLSVISAGADGMAGYAEVKVSC